MCSTFGGQLVTKPRHWYTPPSHASLEECQDGRRRAPSSELQEKAPRSWAEQVSQQHFYSFPTQPWYPLDQWQGFQEGISSHFSVLAQLRCSRLHGMWSLLR